MKDFSAPEGEPVSRRGGAVPWENINYKASFSTLPFFPSLLLPPLPPPRFHRAARQGGRQDGTAALCAHAAPGLVVLKLWVLFVQIHVVVGIFFFVCVCFLNKLQNARE